MYKMASNSNNKRRRTAADTLHISDLPIGFIAEVSAYLVKPSRAIFAVAFTSSSLWQNDNLMHRLSPISTAIMSSSQWDILDFEDVEKELANKLTDDDIYAVLKSINAHAVLKRLKLCGCTNITGIGLNPLRNSTVLEQIDISLAGKYDGSHINPEPKINQAAVVPILDSIMAADECSLKYIQFPHEWRHIGTHNSSGEMHPIIQFRTRFNQYMYSLTSLGLSCSKCNANMRDYREWSYQPNKMICYECLKPICTECGTNGRANFCENCKKKYCTDCTPVTECISCSVMYCEGCDDMEECDECGGAACEECLNTCGECNRDLCAQCAVFRHCDGPDCNKSHCDDCYNNNIEHTVKYCRECESHYCSDCKFDELKEYGVRCNACAGDVAHLIVQEIGKLRKKNEEQGKENEELVKENEELRRKVDSMSL